MADKKLRKATYVKVKDLTPGTQGHNLVARVVSVKLLDEKKRFDGTSTRLAEVVLGDETGVVTFTARNEQIEALPVDTTVVIRNSSADIFNGFIRLNVNQWGKISRHPDGVASTPEAPSSVKQDNDISSVEYELVSVDQVGGKQ
ncbi:hypothetical protein PINS_up010698 [Pythium insidiosum]|nr:hypothetical protein PINS_up010698 [Pythium insidiosum]